MTDRERNEPFPGGDRRQPPPPPPPPVQPSPPPEPYEAPPPGPPPEETSYWRPQQPEAWTPASTRPDEPEPHEAYRPPAAPEAADTVARTSPVPPTEVRRSGGAKWGIALVVVALAIGATAAAIFLLTGSTSPSALVGYAPPNTVVYGELRLDLPGDQRAKVADFLSHFPGFDDRSTLETKVVETLDLRLSDATDGEIDYSADIQPWFGGQVSFSIGELPDPDDPASVRGALMVSVTDGARALAWVEEVSEGAFETTTYGGTQMLVHDEDEVEVGVAVADGRVMVLGDRTSVERAIDSRGQSGLGSDGGFAAALDAAPTSAVGFGFIDAGVYMDWFFRAADDMGEEMPCGFDAATFEPYIPAWVAFGARVESDGVRLEVSMPPVEALPMAANSPSRVAEYAPPGTLLLADGHDVGITLTRLIDIYRDCPEARDAFVQAESMLTAFGGVNGTVDWIDDAGVVVAESAEGDIDGGLVITPTDAGNARERLTAVYNLIVVGGSQVGIRTSEEDYNGVPIRTISGNLEDLGALTGAPATGVDDELEVAYAATDEIIIFGGNATFVKNALDAAAGDSLADTERYRNAVGQVGAENAGIAFVDVTKAREMMERVASEQGTDLDEYDTEIRPWIEPFDILVQATVSGNPNQSRGYLILKPE